MVKTSMGSDENVPHRAGPTAATGGRVGSLKPSILVASHMRFGVINEDFEFLQLMT